MTSFTPGPWRVGFADGSAAEDFTIVAGPLAATLEQVVVWGGDSFGFRYGIRNEANARLIAAAPELYEAAKAALLYLPGGYQFSRCHDGIFSQEECSTCQAKSALAAAIAAVEGVQP